MDLRKPFDTVAEYEQDGIEVHLAGDAYITLARAGGSNVRYQKAVARMLSQHRRAFEATGIDVQARDEFLKPIFAQTVILGWRGVELDGQVLAYSQENALRLLRELPNLWDILWSEATKLENFRHEEVAELGKASGSA